MLASLRVPELSRYFVASSLLVSTLPGCGCERRTSELSVPSAKPAPSVPASAHASPAPFPENCQATTRRPALPEHLSPWHRRQHEACGSGDEEACAVLGTRLFYGQGGPEAAVLAASLLDGACRRGSAEGCWTLGRAHRDGIGVATSLRCAEAFLRAACERGQMEACGDLVLGLRGDGGLRYDPEAAAALERERCVQGDCFRDAWAELAGDAGARVRCEEGDFFACNRVPVLDPEVTGFSLFMRTCEGGSSVGCGRLRRALEPPVSKEAAGQAERIIQTFRTACERGNPDACDHLIEPSKPGGAGAWVSSPRERQALRELACRHGVARRCRELGEAGREAQVALEFYERACGAPRGRHDGLDIDGVACERLGDHYRGSAPGKGDEARALTYYERGCFAPGRSRSDGACAKLRDAYRSGLVGPPDPERAASLDASLCAIGSPHCEKGHPDIGTTGLESPFQPCRVLPLGATCYVERERGRCEQYSAHRTGEQRVACLLRVPAG